MRKSVLLVIGIVFLSILFSCSSNTQNQVPLEESGYQAIYQPVWYNPDSCQATEEYLCQRATMESKDQQFAITKASQEARAGLQSQLETKMEILYKGFAEEIGLAENSDFNAMYVQTIQQVTSGIINLSVPYREEVRKDPEKNLYRAWVMYRLLLNDAFLSQLKSIRSNNNMYTRFRQSEAFKEHEKEIERFEKYKEEHGY